MFSGLSVDFVAHSTFLYFASFNESPENATNTLDVAGQKSDQSSIHKNGFGSLKDFYSVVYENDFELASLSVVAWVSIGLNVETLTTLMTTAATFSIAFEIVRFFSKIVKAEVLTTLP